MHALGTLAALSLVGFVLAQEGRQSSAEQRTLAALPKSSYFLLPPCEDPTGDEARGLLVVMPGGDGSKEFLPFVANGVHGQQPRCHCAMATAVQWQPDQKIVWPTAQSKVPGMGYTTEDYVRALVADVQQHRKVDPAQIVLLAWSSSGPAAYAILLGEKSPFRGGYVAMSIWPRVTAADLQRGKGKRLLLDQSPDDTVTRFVQCKMAFESLTCAGAIVRLSTYAGGHGWNDSPLPRLRRGLQWLASDQPAPPPSWPDAAPKKPGKPVKAGAALLVNGSFEDGTDGWTVTNNSGRLTAAAEAGGKHGKQALHLQKTGGLPLDLLAQEVTELPKDGRLTARAWVRSQGSKNAWLKCFLYKGDAVVHEDVDLAQLRGDTDWQLVEKAWDVAGADRAVFQVVMVMGGEVWVDGCELVPTRAK